MKNNPRYKNVVTQIRFAYSDFLSGRIPVYLTKEQTLTLAKKSGYDTLDDTQFNEALEFLSAYPDHMIYLPKKEECYLILGDGLYQEDYNRNTTSSGESVWKLIRQAEDRFQYFGVEMTSSEIEDLFTGFVNRFGSEVLINDLEGMIKLAKTAGYPSPDSPVFMSALISLEKQKKIYLIKHEECYVLLHESWFNTNNESSEFSVKYSGWAIQDIQEAKTKYLKA